MVLRFVITGTGRCGTGYTAALFQAAGLQCGHEDVFKEKPGLWDKAAPRSGLVARLKEPLGRVKEEVRRRHTTLDGDASWMAVPRLERFKGVRFLQLRDPLKVVSSFTGTRFFSREPKVQNRFAAAHFRVTGDDVRDAMRWWVEWNRLGAKGADLVYRIEDLDTDQFAEMLKMVGGVRDPQGAAIRAFAAVPSNVNAARAHTSSRRDLSWNELPEGPEKEALWTAALEFGYEVSSIV